MNKLGIPVLKDNYIIVNETITTFVNVTKKIPKKKVNETEEVKETVIDGEKLEENSEE